MKHQHLQVGGGACSSNLECELMMDSSKELFATFDIEEVEETGFTLYLPIVVR